MKKKKNEFLNLSVLEGENQSFAKEVINKKKNILIFRITIASLLFIFILSMLFLPVFQTKVKLVSEYDTDNVKWEKTYRYSLMSSFYQGISYFIDGVKRVQNNGDNLPEMIEVSESNNKFNGLVIKSDELVKQDVERRRTEQNSSYAKRKNTVTWITFLNKKIEENIAGLKMNDDLKKEYANKEMDKQNQLMTIFLPEIEAGNIIGLNQFIDEISTTVSEEKFNLLMNNYLVGDYTYDEKNIEQMCELKNSFGILDFYYLPSYSTSSYTYWEECFGLLCLLDVASGAVLVLFLILLIFYLIPLIVSLIKIWSSKEITTLKLMHRGYKVGPIVTVLIYPIVFLLSTTSTTTELSFLVKFWFSGYSFFGIIAILCAIGLLVVCIIHNKVLKQMKREIDEKINHFVNDNQ